MAVNLPSSRTINLNNWAASGDGKIYGKNPLGDRTTGSGTPDVPTIYLPSKPSWAQTQLLWIHWSVPARAYPGIDLDYKLTGYDWFNETLTWSLQGSPPSGLSINSSTGVLTWTPSTPSQDGDHSITVRLTTTRGDYVEKTWTINVNTSDFIFVSLAPAGNDTTGDGSISTPYATYEHAANQIVSGSSKDILIRGGTYNEVLTSWPFSGDVFSEDSSVRVAAYPTETVIFDPQNNITEPLHSGGYVVLDKIECRNFTMDANQNYGGIYTAGKGAAAKRCIVRDSDWNDNANTSGFCCTCGSLLDSCEAYDNYDRTPLTEWNSSNYVYYADRNTSAGPAFVIDSYSGGWSPVGYKVKHTLGGDKWHIHRSVSVGSKYPIGEALDYCTFRHGISIPSVEYRGSTMGVTSPTSANTQGMLWEACLFVQRAVTSGQASSAVRILNYNWWTTTTPDTGPYLKDCIIACAYPSGTFASNLGYPIAVNNDTAYNLNIVDNTLYTPLSTKLMVAYDTENEYDITALNALAYSSGNTYGGDVPATIDFDCGGGTTLGTRTWQWTSATNALTDVT